MTASTITISGTLAGLPSGSKLVNETVAIATPIDDSVQTNLTSGANTFAVPTGATNVCIVPPTTNTTVTLTLKGAGGDTGIILAMAAPSWISLGAGNANVIINASAT